MIVAKVVFWLSLGGILWTHLGYPLAAALLARLRRRGVRHRSARSHGRILTRNSQLATAKIMGL